MGAWIASERASVSEWSSVWNEVSAGCWAEAEKREIRNRAVLVVVVVLVVPGPGCL